MIKQLYGLTLEQYEEFKKAVKKEIPFTVSVRYCKRKYAYGAVSILPMKKDSYTWNEEQFQSVKSFVKKYHLTTEGSYLDTENEYIIYQKGMEFIYSINKNFGAAEEVYEVTGIV